MPHSSSSLPFLTNEPVSSPSPSSSVGRHVAGAGKPNALFAACLVMSIPTQARALRLTPASDLCTLPTPTLGCSQRPNTPHSARLLCWLGGGGASGLPLPSERPFCMAFLLKETYNNLAPSFPVLLHICFGKAGDF